MHALSSASRWSKDPFVWAAAIIAMAATAYALFAGRYLPYIDWSNHLGLIAVLADGGSTGALDYLERSFAPSPYLLFYLVTAAIAQLVPVDAAAKIAIVLSTGLLTCAVASLAEACGRSPRLAAIAPLAVFGVSLGYGFGSFVFGTPFLFASLAAAERVLHQSTLRRVAWLGVWLSLTYLAHGFVFLITLLLLAIRTVFYAVFLWWKSRKEPHLSRVVLRPLLAILIAILPAIVVALPATIGQVARPEIEAGSEAAPESQKIFHFVPFAEHHSQIGGHLLERGSPHHWTIMWCTLLLLLICLLLPLLEGSIAGFRGIDRPQPQATFAPEIYGILLALLFLLGPMSVEWPSSIWYVYPRFGVIAGVALFLIPRPRLSGAVGVVIVAASLALVVWNAALNAGHIRNFSAWANQYDPVREAVPRGARVLALTVVSGPDLSQMHPAMGSLYFYHLVDGAAYTAFLFDKVSLPVHSRAGVPQPRAPFWRAVHSFDPAIHGVDFDYLVLRGAGIVSRAQAAGTHELLREANGWYVFKTKNPTPRPSR